MKTNEDEQASFCYVFHNFTWLNRVVVWLNAGIGSNEGFSSALKQAPRPINFCFSVARWLRNEVSSWKLCALMTTCCLDNQYRVYSLGRQEAATELINKN